MPIRKHNEVVSAELNVQPNNEEKLYCEMADGTDISYIDDIKYRKFFSRFTNLEIIRWHNIECLVYNYENFRIDYEIYDSRNNLIMLNESVPNGKEFFGYIIKSIPENESNVFRLDIAFTINYIMQIQINLSEKGVVEDGINDHLEQFEHTGRILKMDKLPVYIKLKYDFDSDNEDNDIIAFKIMPHEAIRHLDSIYKQVVYENVYS